ncbi:nuclear receptor coactivator 5 isoform X1 [Melopsittacus undulatus]|uniref:nuclear receptor coactivator 5 isoform X1 n=2 Tax=Melopsittacus undulatus TaxID=13146 RepID=UPI00108F5CB5|nr:nuclear receptor coactivator 5 isoform X1 [Melopsittacus undulatus]XP_030910369.1 nuclear receptor coactivator 5 isoform X1 [Melopsittacus undulatus]XP_033922546.1 nuclear receptor coactivator 5 isoform X1 [Melopsittacus undulatus]
MARGRKSNSIKQSDFTNSTNPQDLERRLFVGNLPTDHMTREEMEEIFSKYGKIRALSMYHGYGFVQYDRLEDVQAALDGEKGRLYKGYRLDINKAVERRNMNKASSRSSPARREPYAYGDGRDTRRDRSPLRGSPRRDPRDGRNGRDSRDTRDIRARDMRDARDHRDPRDLRDPRDIRDPRDLRDPRDVRDLRDPREPLYDRYRDPRDMRNPRDVRDPRDMRDPRDPLYRRDESYDRYIRFEDYCRRKDDSYYDRYKEHFDRAPVNSDERLKREERRREELYRQYYEEIKRRFDAERPVDCSVIVVNKQTKEYAESVGRKVRDLGMVVDLIFLNTEMSLTQALDDVSRGGSPFAIVITQQHQVHRSCTVNIMFGTPQEHRNMPQADAMMLVARNYERYKTECREKERDEIARQAAKMADEAVLQERERPGPGDEGARGGHPPAIQTLLNLLADNRYLTAEEMDKVINYLRERKERLLRGSTDTLQAPMARQSLGAPSGPSLGGQSSLPSSQAHQGSQPLVSAPSVPVSSSNPQQELQAKILSLFNSGAAAVANSTPAATAGTAGSAPNQNFASMGSGQARPAQMGAGNLNQAQQRLQTPSTQIPALQGPSRNAGPRPGAPPQAQSLYGQHQNRLPAPSNVPAQRPVSSGINFDNPSVQKALDTLIQSGPALSHLVSQTVAQGRAGSSAQQPMGSYQRHY